MPSELSGAIRRGLERGESLERARLSLINAGYNREEVEEAIREVSSPSAIVTPESPQLISRPVASPVFSTAQVPSTPSPPQKTVPQSYASLPTKNEIKSKSRDIALIILLIFIVLVISFALTIGFFFEQLKGLFGL